MAGDALKGCAAKLLREFDLAVNPATIANHYGDLLDGLVVDQQDAAFAAQIEKLGIAVLVAQTVMRSDADRDILARAVLEFAATIDVRQS